MSVKLMSDVSKMETQTKELERYMNSCLDEIIMDVAEEFEKELEQHGIHEESGVVKFETCEDYSFRD